jgi:hypothetical protein
MKGKQGILFCRTRSTQRGNVYHLGSPFQSD